MDGHMDGHTDGPTQLQKSFVFKNIETELITGHGHELTKNYIFLYFKIKLDTRTSFYLFFIVGIYFKYCIKYR